MYMKSIYLFYVASLQNLIYGYNILVVSPTPSISHQIPITSLSRALAEKGHNVTIITANPGLYKPLKNYHEIDVSFSYESWNLYQKRVNYSFQTKLSGFKILTQLPMLLVKIFETILDSDAVQQIIRCNSTKIDLIIYPGFYPSALGFVHHFNYPPSIVLFTIPKNIPVQYFMGNPINPSYVPSFVTEYSDKMTFFQRIRNSFYILYELYVFYYYIYPEHDVIAKKTFGDNVPPTKDLERNNSLMLLSGDLTQDYPQPLQPNIIQVGAWHLRNDEILPHDIKKWMDESEEGVIYFSFGSNMKSTSSPEEKRNAFAKAFVQLKKFRVVWKWESEVEFPGKPDNVLLKKWLPQQAILAHPKTRLFITQGGHQSRQEAIHYEVPTLIIPLFWDQEWNAKKSEVSGIGLILSFSDITYENVCEKLKTLLGNESFKQNVEEISKISKDKPMSNIDTAIWWIEYVVRYKAAPHLRPAVQDLYWYQMFLLDIIATGLVLMFLFFYSFYYLITRLVFTSKNKLKTQ